MASHTICMISDDFAPEFTGVGRHVQILSRQLVKLGHEVHVITSKTDEQPEYEVIDGAYVHRLHSWSPPLMPYRLIVAKQNTARKLFDEINPSILHFHYLGAFLVRALNAAKQTRCKRIYTFHMDVTHLTPFRISQPFRPLLRSYFNRHCNRFDHGIVVSGNAIEPLRDSGITIPLTYISNPLENVTEPDPNRPLETDFTILSAGRLAAEKNIPFLVDTFHAFCQKFPQSRLWIAGDGEQRGLLEKQVTALGLSSKVEFLGHLDRVRMEELFQRCDVFAFPTKFETQGAVAMEAMSFAKPVVVSNSIVSADELVDDGVNGFLIDPDNQEQFVEKLEALANNPELRKQMGAQGKSKSAAYSPEAIAQQTLDIYQSGN